MKNRIKYTDEPLGDVRVIKDFLPPPEDLVLKDKTVKVTLSEQIKCGVLQTEG